MVVEIAAAGPGRVNRLVEVLARSFADDPIVRWPFPTDGNAEEECRKLFRVLEERFVQTGWLWEAGDAAEPHWFLDHLAVAPERRGEGLGTPLVELGPGFARRDGAPAFLGTARPGNVGYYERLGFQVVADEHAPGGGPPVWFMRFDP